MTNENISETLRIKIEPDSMVIVEFQGERLILTISEASELSTNLKNMIKFSTENDSGFSNTLILESCPKS